MNYLFKINQCKLKANFCKFIKNSLINILKIMIKNY